MKIGEVIRSAIDIWTNDQNNIPFRLKRDTRGVILEKRENDKRLIFVESFFIYFPKYGKATVLNKSEFHKVG